MHPTVLQDLIGDEARAAFEGGRTLAILPLGSTEYHGPRGPYGTDHYAVWEIGKRVSAATGALLLPAMPYGHSPDHQDYVGTVHLQHDTLKAVLMDVARSLRRHGVSRLLMLLGHWGNYEVALEIKRAGAEADLGIHVEVLRLFDESELDLDGLAEVFPGKQWQGHGGAVEVSAALSARPHLRPPLPEEVTAKHPPLALRRSEDLGWSGLPEEASGERGEAAVDVTARAIVAYLRDRLRW